LDVGNGTAINFNNEVREILGMSLLRENHH